MAAGLRRTTRPSGLEDTVWCSSSSSGGPRPGLRSDPASLSDAGLCLARRWRAESFRPLFLAIRTVEKLGEIFSHGKRASHLSLLSRPDLK